jgi:hypothetical protein
MNYSTITGWSPPELILEAVGPKLRNQLSLSDQGTPPISKQNTLEEKQED